MNDKLKPCPFCGGQARLKKHYKIDQTWYVQCHKCGIRTPNSTQAPYQNWTEARDYPVKLWNRRTEGAKNDERRKRSCIALLEGDD